MRKLETYYFFEVSFRIYQVCSLQRNFPGQNKLMMSQFLTSPLATLPSVSLIYFLMEWLTSLSQDLVINPQ